MGTQIAAIFSKASQAEDAVDWLISKGVPLKTITVIDGTCNNNEDFEPYSLLAGAGLVSAGSAMFGLASVGTTGLGANAASAPSGGSVGTGAGVAAAAAITGASLNFSDAELAGWPLDEGLIDAVISDINSGATLVGIDLPVGDITPEEVIHGLTRIGGRIVTGTS